MKVLLAALCVMFIVVGTSAPAWALVYKNPAHPFKVGDSTAGVTVENQTHPATSEGLGSGDLKYTDVLGSYGIGVGTSGLLELQLGLLIGQAEQQDSATGLAYGLAYRHNMGVLGGGNLQHGFLLGIHGGYAGNDTSDTYITQLDAGYGISNPISPTAALYGGAVLQIFYGTLDDFATAAYDFDGDTPLALFGGVSFESGSNLSMGFELHLIAETGFAFYMDSKF